MIEKTRQDKTRKYRKRKSSQKKKKHRNEGAGNKREWLHLDFDSKCLGGSGFGVIPAMDSKERITLSIIKAGRKEARAIRRASHPHK